MEHSGLSNSLEERVRTYANNIVKEATQLVAKSKDLDGRFPLDFLIGTASSAYQIEGAWNDDGKGESICDFASHNHPNWSHNNANGDIACDSYHMLDKDVALLKDLGVNFYRFSIAWSRILPTGDPTNVNKAGIKYYNDLIDRLLDNDIIPVVTMFHFDLPQKLQELGGWTNPYIVDCFEEYAAILFNNFADRVKWWTTVNEPVIYAIFGHSKNPEMFSPFHPPLLDHTGIAEYLVVHNIISAHARTARLYNNIYKPKFRGKIGIVIHMFNFSPVDSKEENIEAAKRAFLFDSGWVLDPLLKGDYPEVMKERISTNSRLEGRKVSRLPEIDSTLKDLLTGSLDFVGLNYYTSKEASNEISDVSPSYLRDMGVKTNFNEEYLVPDSSWLTNFAPGLRNVLNWFKYRYGDIPIFIMENGCDDGGSSENVTDDQTRIIYHHDHLNQLEIALKVDKVNVIGYTVWSFMDSFEWTSGYRSKFGIYHVDFSDPERKRSKKKSFKFFQHLFREKEILRDMIYTK